MRTESREMHDRKVVQDTYNCPKIETTLKYCVLH